MADPAAGPVLSPAIARATAVLDLLAANEHPLGITEIARSIGVAKSSASNVLRTMEQSGLIAREPAGFVLGSKLAFLGAVYLRRLDEVREFTRMCHEIDELRDETVQLAMLDDFDVVYVARHDGTFPVRLSSDVGKKLPASCTGTGKALLASLPEADLRARLWGRTTLPVLTKRSIRSVAELTSNLEQVRDRGYAVDDEETMEGVRCFAVALPEMPQGRRLAVSVTLTLTRSTAARRPTIINGLRSLRSRMSESLGLRGE